MKKHIIEHVFFFGLFGLVGYLMWLIVAPFIATLALSAIIATVAYPLYVRVVRVMPRKNTSLASLISVALVTGTIFAPLFVLGYMLFTQAFAFYERVNAGLVFNFTNSVSFFERIQAQFLPGFNLDIASYAQQAAGWLTSHLGSVFSGTASTVFMLFIMLIALFYMFRDGPAFLTRLIALSPLNDTQDTQIIQKISTSIRSVVLGTLTVALIQGVLTGLGFMLFGIPQPVLWGSIAAIGALIPGVGTSLVFIGAIIFAVLGGSYDVAIGLGVWGIFAVGLIDNLLGPYLMSRGAKLHPFMVLLSVLGGVVLFGPIGFLLGPVALSFFTVLLELFVAQVTANKKHAG